MRIFSITVGFLLAVGGFADAQEKKAKRVTVKTVEGLRYEPVRFKVKRGEKIQLNLQNHDPNDQPHNFVLIKPGTLKDIQAASMAVGPDSVKNAYVPKSDAIILSSGLLNPDEKETIEFEAPKEKGIYPFVCTFPGHAAVMYGALYVDERIAEDVAFDPNVPEIVRAAELEKLKAKVAVERPTIRRAFMPKAGPAAIAVALLGDENFCWDAGNCRLRYAWSGGFVDSTRMWNSNGNALGKILGDEYWNSGGGEKTFGVHLSDAETTAVDFQGYSIVDGLPEFEYRIGDVTVRELISAAEDGGLAWRFKIDKPGGGVRVFAPGNVTGEKGNRDGDFWVVGEKDAAEFVLRIPGEAAKN